MISAIGSSFGTLPVRKDTGTTNTGTTGKTSDTSGSGSSDGDAITNAAGGEMGKDQFIQLLVTEMQNQDPLNPMDGKDLAAQLAQFSSVEQLMDVNTRLDNLTALVQSAMSGAGAQTPATTPTDS